MSNENEKAEQQTEESAVQENHLIAERLAKLDKLRAGRRRLSERLCTERPHRATSVVFTEKNPLKSSKLLRLKSLSQAV